MKREDNSYSHTALYIKCSKLGQKSVVTGVIPITRSLQRSTTVLYSTQEYDSFGKVYNVEKAFLLENLKAHALCAWLHVILKHCFMINVISHNVVKDLCLEVIGAVFIPIFWQCVSITANTPCLWNSKPCVIHDIRSGTS